MTIGIFDSGIGGLSVLKEIIKELPQEKYIYIADQIHVPYGKHSLEQVYIFAKKITEYLVKKNIKLIVIACNTASAAALKKLRLNYPELTFVGMEPAIKPAAQHTITNKIGVIATEATINAEMFKSVKERFAQGVDVYACACYGLAEVIETGKLDGEEIKNLLTKYLIPLKEKGIDQLVLGCTHYPLVSDLIKEIIGKDILLVDPAHAVAKRVKHILELQKKRHQREKETSMLYTTGDPKHFAEIAGIFLNEKIETHKLQL